MIKRTIKYYLASLVLLGISVVTTVGLARSPATSVIETACQGGMVMYKDSPALLLAIPGQAAYYVAPQDAGSKMTWDEVTDTPGICPEGWKVPSSEDFAAMTGITADGNWVATNHEALAAIFGTGKRYWSSSSRYDTLAWGMCIDDDGTTAITNYLKTSKNHVRCVRKK